MIFAEYEERLRRRGAKPNTLKNHRRTATLFRESGLDPSTAEEWQLEEFLAGLPVSPRTRELHQQNLSAVFGYATIRRVIPTNPMRDVRLPRRPDSEPRILEARELRVLRATVQGEQDWVMLHLLAYTGIRRAELRMLTWDDVSPTSIRIVKGKGDKLRHVPVHPHLAEVLAEAAPSICSPFLIHGPRPMQPLSDGGIYARLQHFTAVVDCTFHDFRRTVATSLAENGVQESVIDKIMGWAPRTVGNRYYIRRADETMRAAILQLYADDPLVDAPVPLVAVGV